MSDLEELKRLHEASTQGEWLDAGSGSPFWVKLAGDEFGAGWRDNRDNDAAWVATIHNAFPGIVARLEAAQRLRDAAAKVLDDGVHPTNSGIANLEAAFAAFDKEQQ